MMNSGGERTRSRVGTKGCFSAVRVEQIYDTISREL